MSPTVLDDPVALQNFPRRGRRAVVMTMGGLHRGHADLLDEGRKLVGTGGQLLATIFVNPLQFGAGEDLDRYPRTFVSDLEICANHDVDAVFAPSIAVMYGEELPDISPGITVDPGELGALWEGAVRPGHFRGVLTVVLKLLNLTRPDLAVFGEKDYQQLVMVRRMVKALNVPVEIVGVPTARDEDGLALSSRNVYLSPEERSLAGGIPRAVRAGQHAAAAGANALEVVARTRAVLAEGGVAPDYVAVTDPDLGVAPAHGPARLLVAAHVGGVHLLDNVALSLGGAKALSLGGAKAGDDR